MTRQHVQKKAKRSLHPRMMVVQGAKGITRTQELQSNWYSLSVPENAQIV